MGLTILYYMTAAGTQPVLKFLHALPGDVAGDVYAALDALERLGFEGANLDTKQIKGKLREIRFIRIGYRVFYVLVDGAAVVLLHAIKKEGQKPAKSDLDLAEKRMKEVLGKR